MTSRVRVLVADDHAGMLDALVAVLQADSRFVVAGTATTGDDAYGLAARHPVDVVLLDVHMPGGGPAAAERIATLPNPPVVVAVSAQPGAGIVEEMLRAGAAGYLMKGRMGEAFPDLLLRCLGGEVVLETPSAAGVLRPAPRGVPA
jgi:DNA-binding NarL/FixJ family response regulator